MQNVKLPAIEGWLRVTADSSIEAKKAATSRLTIDRRADGVPSRPHHDARSRPERPEPLPREEATTAAAPQRAQRQRPGRAGAGQRRQMPAARNRACRAVARSRQQGTDTIRAVVHANLDYS